ncbi:protein kinase domain-containing protein [Desulfatirhabdium butyrativorans]|uniref:protein kinase domain-containing protein n=1 Tax=Desulfatirhabdium butyrativorans TaxID=340467 RepID=UPI0003FE2785|nr:protein kinase [Desulfatirhabdium butyrativorans]
MKTIGKYRILGLLGKGGTSRVYKVMVPEIGNIVALKWLYPHPFLLDLLGMEKLEELFLSEARIMAKLRHPHLLPVWDYGVALGRPFYTMEYLCDNVGLWIGEGAEVEIPTRQLPVDMALRITRETLSGLARMHAGGWIHRDIKPFNLLLTDQSSVRIADFGLSLTRGEKAAYPKNLKIGSPYYAPPEQEAAPDSVGFSSDLYSVGVTLYRMLTGNLPQFSMASIADLVPELDETWDMFFRSAIAPDPKRRFQTAEDMDAAIQELQQSWERRKSLICQLEPEPKLIESQIRDPTNRPIRHLPQKIGFHEARECFHLDLLWRPDHPLAPDFVSVGKNLVADRVNGLIWEQSGSAYPENVRQSLLRIERMNRERFCGIGSWRLPTVEEMLTLIAPPSRFEKICAPSFFDPLQKRLWSIDRKSATACWFASLDVGFVHWLDVTGYAYSRAVSTA